VFTETGIYFQWKLPVENFSPPEQEAKKQDFHLKKIF
jgi:hypothetical protein